MTTGINDNNDKNHIRKSVKLNAPEGISITGGVIADNDLSSEISNIISGIFNRNSTAYDQAIDSAYVHEGIGSSATHHIVDGSHTFWGSFNAAREAGGSTTEQASAAFEHLLRDFSTTSGINPFFSMDAETLEKLKNYLENIHIPHSTVNDILTTNAFEAAGAVLAGLAAYHGFKNKDFESLGRVIGSGSAASIISSNSLLAVVTIVIGALAWRKSSGGERKQLVENVIKGGLVAGTVSAVSACIGGPVIVGLAPAIYSGYVVNNVLSGKKCDDIVSRTIKKGIRVGLSAGLQFVAQKIR